MGLDKSIELRRCFLFIFCALFINGNISAQKSDGDNSEKIKQADAIFERWNKPGSAGLSISVVEDGAVVYKRGFGVADLEHDTPITSSTMFHAASVSKQFTAFSILLLADQGKLGLEDDIRKYLPETPDFGKTIRIRHLLHHTSGLRDQAELAAIAGVKLNDVLTQSHVLKLVQRQKELNFNPGDEFVYCNTGYTLLAQIVAQVSGKSFREFTEESIFRPLGMSNSHFRDDYHALIPSRANSYVDIGNGRYISMPLNYANVGSTNLMTTVEDLGKWLQNFEQATVGGENLIKKMRMTGVLNNGKRLNYGAGLDIGTYAGLENVSHGGGDAGFRSYIVYFPKQKFGIAILSNFVNFNARTSAEKIVDIFLRRHFVSQPDGEEKKNAPDQKGPDPYKMRSSKLNEYKGEFYSSELDAIYKINVKGDKLIASHIRNDDVELKPIGVDKFSGEMWWFKQVIFVRDKKNYILGFRLSTFRGVRNLKFIKLK